MGQSRYTCRYGTLSDGHERITEAQRYYASIKEAYTRAQTLKGYKIEAMLAQADLIEAQENLEKAVAPSEKLRAEASILAAQLKLENSLVNAEDTMRQLDEFNKVRLELQDAVRAQYPQGIEQAEADSWAAVARHRAVIENITHVPQNLRHIPLAPVDKALLGIETGKSELMAWLAIAKPENLKQLEQAYDEHKLLVENK